jgi:hypothetical protein
MRAIPGAFALAILPEQIMTIRNYILRRLNQGETDLKVLVRQTRFQFPSLRVNLSYIRTIRNEWQKASVSLTDESEKLSERELNSLC